MSQSIEKKLLKRVGYFAPFISAVPYVRLIALCNNLSFGRVDEGSDIDLFVVARGGRLFTTRLFLTLFLQIFGVRRHGGRVSGRFCLSFFVDDSFDNFAGLAIENDYYLAFWLSYLLPVYDEKILDRLLLKNAWIDDFVLMDGDIVRPEFGTNGFLMFLRRAFEFVWDLTFGRPVEFLLMKWQLRRARKKYLALGKPLGIMINKHVLKFHNMDMRKDYRDDLMRKYGRQKLNLKEFLDVIR